MCIESWVRGQRIKDGLGIKKKHVPKQGDKKKPGNIFCSLLIAALNNYSLPETCFFHEQKRAYLLKFQSDVM